MSKYTERNYFSTEHFLYRQRGDNDKMFTTDEYSEDKIRQINGYRAVQTEDDIK